MSDLDNALAALRAADAAGNTADAQQLAGIVQKLSNTSTAIPQDAPTPSEQTYGKQSGLGDIGASVVDAIPKGFSDLVGLPSSLMNLGHTAGNYVADKLGMNTAGIDQMNRANPVAAALQNPFPSSEGVRGAIEKVIGQPLYQPQTLPGKLAGATAEGAASMPAAMGVGALSGLGGEVGGEAFKGTPYETPARIAGGFIGGMAPSAARGLFGAGAEVPTADALRDAAGQSYDDARNLGVVIKAPAVANLSDDIRSGLVSDGINGKLAPKTFSILDELQNPPSGAVATLADLETARRTFGHAASDFLNPTEQKAASTAINQLDDYLSNIPKADVISGDAVKASQILGEARGNYAAAKRSDTIAGKLDTADIRSAVANSGQNYGNTARSRIADILLQPKLRRGFSPEELAQMERVARGTAIGNTTRFAGNLLGGGGGLGALLTGGAGALAGGPLGAVALPAAGYALKKLSNASTERQLKILESLVLSRSPLARSMPQAASASAGYAPAIAAILAGQRQ